MNRKIISLILAFVLAAASLLGGAGSVSAASQDTYAALEAAVDKQIRAFGDSIDKSNADDSAAAALAKHGMTGSGKTLKVGKSHALTAAMWNSELLRVAAIKTCAAAIAYMQKLNEDYLPYVKGNCDWKGANSGYGSVVYTANDRESEHRELEIVGYRTYTGTRNSYDSSLEWIVREGEIQVSFQRKKVTQSEITYEVTYTVFDRFDFDTSQGSGFDKLIAGLGAVMFREFTWESTVTFTLTVPNTCDHSTHMYHFIYDATSCVLTSDTSGGYTPNEVTLLTKRCHELDNPIRLYHNKPWAMEYTICNFGYFTISPLEQNSMQQLSLMNYNNSALMLQQRKIVKQQTVYDCYGIRYDKLLSSKTVYTFRLENVIDAKGNNMVYLTIIDADSQEPILSKSPMNKYYENVGGVLPLNGASSNYLNGVDLFFSYVGNKNYEFHADYFDLKVWENGIEVGSGTYFEAKVTKPTCTAQGYTTYTCSCCGYSYKGDKVKATGHSFGDWTTVTAATCTENGEEQRKCKNCDHSENRTVDALGHNYENYVCTNCGDMEYVSGDTDLNGTVDVDDVLTLLWNVLFPEEYPIEVAADFDGDGVTDVDDVLTLLWHVLFPEEYPLN